MPATAGRDHLSLRAEFCFALEKHRSKPVQFADRRAGVAVRERAGACLFYARR
jgi:hypothetical protein